MWVNEIVEGREKNWEFHTLFRQLLEQPCKFYECCLKHFDTY